MKDEFVNPKLSVDNLDRYYQRSAILNALSSNLSLLVGNLLDVGCGKMPYKEFIVQNSEVKKYIGLDIATAMVYDENVKPDFTWDGIKMPFISDSFDSAIATEVLEHCLYPQITLSEIYRVLNPGAPFFFTVPFLWNLHEVPHDEFRYTPFSLRRFLEQAGFVNISLFSFGGWHASMAQMLGLWLRRAPMNNRLRKSLSLIAMPIYKRLINASFDPSDFREGTMISGMYGIAHKPEVKHC